MRILHVISSFQLGGAEVSVVQLAQALQGVGHTCCVVQVVAPRKPSLQGKKLVRECLESGVKVVELGWGGKRTSLLTSPIRLARLIRLWAPDLVHSHTDLPDFVVSVVTRLRPVKIVRTIRNTELWPTRPLTGRIVEQSFRDDMVVSISADASRAYDQLRASHSLPQSRYRAIINTGFCATEVHREKNRSILAARYEADLSKIQLCFAGRFVPQKGLDILIAAIDRLGLRARANLEIHCFGEGPYLAELKAAKASGLPIKIHLPVPQIAELFSAFDYTLIPSRFEGLCRVSLESLIAGTPVIASDAPGLRETLPNDWPLTFPNADTVTLATILCQVASGAFDDKMDALRSRGTEWVKSRFSMDAMVRAYESVYELYLSGKPFSLDFRNRGCEG